MKHEFIDVGVSGMGHTLSIDEGITIVDNAAFIRKLPLPAAAALMRANHDESEPFNPYTLPADKVDRVSADWATNRPGITTRHVAKLTTVQLAALAARRALDTANLKIEDMGAIIFSSNTPDQIYPKSADALLRDLGGTTATFCVDIKGSCADGGAGLVLAASLVASGFCQHVLFAASERETALAAPEDYKSCNLFGDGAGVFIVSRIEGETIRVLTEDDPFDGKWDLIAQDRQHGPYRPMWSHWEVRTGPFKQDGQAVHKWVGHDVVPAIVRFITEIPNAEDQLKLIVLHQASGTTLDMAEKKLTKDTALPWLRDRFYSNVRERGNTSSASTLIALSEARYMGLIKPRDLVAGITFGAGLEKVLFSFRVCN